MVVDDDDDYDPHVVNWHMTTNLPAPFVPGRLRAARLGTAVLPHRPTPSQEHHQQQQQLDRRRSIKIYPDNLSSPLT